MRPEKQSNLYLLTGLPIQVKQYLMNGAAKKLYTVTANGTESIPMTKASAERVAKALRSGKGGHKPVSAEVKAVG